MHKNTHTTSLLVRPANSSPGRRFKNQDSALIPALLLLVVVLSTSPLWPNQPPPLIILLCTRDGTGWQEQDVKLAAAHELQQEEKRSKGRQLDGRGRVLLRERLELTGAESSK